MVFVLTSDKSFLTVQHGRNLKGVMKSEAFKELFMYGKGVAFVVTSNE